MKKTEIEKIGEDLLKSDIRASLIELHMDQKEIKEKYFPMPHKEGKKDSCKINKKAYN